MRYVWRGGIPAYTKRKVGHLMNTIIITGASGFIGQHLTDYLADDGNTVITIPRELLQNPKDLTLFMKKVRPDYVLNLAAYGNHSDQTNRQEAIHANILLQDHLFQSLETVSLKGFIQFGSSSEYGYKKTKMREDMLLEPRTAYEATKAAASLLAQSFGFMHNQPVVVVRPFSVYGEGEADHRFIPTAIRCIYRNIPLNLFPDGVHDWIYIEDFLEGVVAVLNNMPVFNQRIVNIGSGVELRNDQIVEQLLKITGKPLRIKLIESPSPHMSYRWKADNSLLKSVGWKPIITLSKGLQRVLPYYRAKYGHKQ